LRAAVDCQMGDPGSAVPTKTQIRRSAAEMDATIYGLPGR